MSISPNSKSNTSDPLEYFVLPRSIRRGVRASSEQSAQRTVGDVFYLWVQLDADGDSPAVASDTWLNVVDEAAAIGANWLVITLGDLKGPVEHIEAMCRWAQDTHQMTVCLHSLEAALHPSVESLLLSLSRELTYLLVEPEHASAFTSLCGRGVRIGLANPAPNTNAAACKFPYKMVFVDAQGSLYTCGLVSGEKEFFLGTVFNGSLEQITHNPQLPHSVDAPGERPEDGCSGCPPLVAKYLCADHREVTG